MANRHRGEIDAIFDGKTYTLCLTLGALAELESAFGDEDMVALADRFSAGRISARDAIRVIGAGLRGAGHQLDDSDVAAMRADGGAAGFVETVARLLTVTFGDADRPDARSPTAQSHAGSDGEAADRPPFPGTTS